MGSKIIATCTLLIGLFMNTTAVYANGIISINDLVNKSLKLDEKNITIQAEAIGEVLERGSYAWINVNDGSNAIGVWLKLEETQTLEYFGDYFHHGDIVRIKGVFNRACVEHGGELDIHAFNIEIIEEGHPVLYEISSWKFTLAMVLMCLGLGLAYLNRAWFLKVKTKSINE